ncbi:succinylglutamate desuccinylase/aspartoacylase family protein [Pseudoalteromonas sp.]|uniref:succinylglutamate desuccinylase/aspartoacylase domain-containing protein n=1 Tax=Pseudoalteromonas sp. TaxID=53249 RepID=UPI003568322B
MTAINLSHVFDNHKVDNHITVHEFLRSLSGPTVFHFKGRKTGKTRIITTLLHGNEPSGIKALFQLFKQGFKPMFNTQIIVASVTAAKTEPEFSHRMLPGKRDLNRCFSPPYHDVQGKLAESIKDYITSLGPEFVLDIHNTSGSGPAFAVVTETSEQHLAIASYFCYRQILTDISLGSLMECDFNCPVITIEGGGCQDEEADLTVYQGLVNLLSSENIEQQHSMQTLKHPRRFELKQGVNLVYGDSPNPYADITILPNIEKYNFGVTQAGTLLGYMKSDSFEQVMLDDGSNISTFFSIKQQRLTTKKSLNMFMITTRPDIAKNDCLFYFVVAEGSL